MPKFVVQVTGGDLEQANAVLNGAGIPTIGTTEAYYESEANQPHPLMILRAVVEAETPDRAAAQVSAALAGEGSYTTGRVEPYG
jgi:hypothetical protein